MEEKTEIYTLTKKKILEAASTCPTTKKALEILFPKAFEPEEQYFKAGTIFRVTHWSGSDPLTRTQISPGYFNRGSNAELHIPIDHKFGEPCAVYAPLNQLIMLVHECKAHEYRLVHLGTSYKYNSKIYLRSSKGVGIPAEDLVALEMIVEGQGK